MANWYNQVFEKAPEKGAPPRMYELPHVFDPQNEDEEIEKILETNKLDYVFSNNYNFRQLPTGTEERKNFLNNAKSRQQNPAGIPMKIQSAALQLADTGVRFGRDTLYGLTNWFFGENSYIRKPIKLFQQQQAVRGGSSQKKRQRYNQRKTQRKNYSPKNFSPKNFSPTNYSL
jgi:hypothetical protein